MYNTYYFDQSKDHDGLRGGCVMTRTASLVNR